MLKVIEGQMRKIRIVIGLGLIALGRFFVRAIK